jgi:hypothetical protein
MFMTNSIALFDKKYAQAKEAGLNPRWMSCGSLHIVCTEAELKKELIRRDISTSNHKPYPYVKHP